MQLLLGGLCMCNEYYSWHLIIGSKISFGFSSFLENVSWGVSKYVSREIQNQIERGR